jgi:hypothetical protein
MGGGPGWLGIRRPLGSFAFSKYRSIAWHRELNGLEEAQLDKGFALQCRHGAV